MFRLYFNNVYAILTLVLVAAVFALLALLWRNRARVTHWGRWTWLTILIGLGISGLSAMRDAYMAPGALIAVDSWQSTVCSLAGGAILLAGLVGLFLRSQSAKARVLVVIGALFTVQVLAMEVSRPFLLFGGL